MRNLFRAFFFKLKKDLTFRITLFVGLGLATLMTIIYLLIDVGMNAMVDNAEFQHMFCTGHNMFITSLSPVQNFGIAIPINLITFTVLEFSQGTIRNKIITGSSKTKIYFSLVLSGLVFTFALIISYVGLCTAVSSIIGGFDVNGIMVGTNAGKMCPELIWKISVCAVSAYILITVATIFFATLLRNIGPCIPIVVILLMGTMMLSTILGVVKDFTELSDIFKVIYQINRYLNPFNALFAFDIKTAATENNPAVYTISNESLIIELTNNAIYTTAFLIGGWLIFRKRDVK